MKKLVGLAVAALLVAAAPVGAQQFVEDPVVKNLKRYEWIAKMCEKEMGVDTNHSKNVGDMDEVEMQRFLDAEKCTERNFRLDWEMREQGLQGLTPIR